MTRWRRYVEAGGHLILSLRTGTKDRNAHLWEGPWAAPILDLIGAQVRLYDVLPAPHAGKVESAVSSKSYEWTVWAEALVPQAGTTVLARHTDQFYKGEAAAVTRRAREGDRHLRRSRDGLRRPREGNRPPGLQRPGVAIEDYPDQLLVDWRDGFWIASNFSSSSRTHPLPPGVTPLVGGSTAAARWRRDLEGVACRRSEPRSPRRCFSCSPRRACLSLRQHNPHEASRDWPPITRDTKPWTRWWWHGSAVERASLTSDLEALQQVGIGGVEITPIYGIRGGDTSFLGYLSDAWMDVFDHTLREASRLDIGVDMATGTGWPFGGPWVTDETRRRARSCTKRGRSTPASRSPNGSACSRRRSSARSAIRSTRSAKSNLAKSPRPVGSTQQPQMRKDVRPLQIGDLAFPVSANKNLQALAIEQVKYPRDLPAHRGHRVR